MRREFEWNVRKFPLGEKSMSAWTLFFVLVMLLAFVANTLGQTFEEKVGTAVERLTPVCY
jgi:hypothetical protein